MTIQPVASTVESRAFPLTAAQLGLWYQQQAEPDNPLFNTAQYVEIDGPLDVAAFEQAVNQAVSEADAWAISITETPTGPQQRLLEAHSPWLERLDCSTAVDPRDHALRLIEQDRVAILDLQRQPLARHCLYVLGGNHYVWYQRVHHLATDGYATALVNRRIIELYDAATTGKTAGQPLAPFSLVEATEAPQPKDADYWRDALQGLPEQVGLTADRAPAATSNWHTELNLDDSTLAAIAALAERTAMSWPDVLTALVGAYCQRFAGSAEIVAGVPHMARFGSPLARVPAMVMNVLPLRIAPSPDAPVTDFLTATAKTLMRSRRHGKYRSEQMRRDLGLIGRGRRLYGPLINVLPFDQPLAIPGLRLTTTVLSTGPVDDLTITFRGDGRTTLALQLDAHPGRYTETETAAHATRLQAFIAQATRAVRLSDIALATPDEAEHLIYGVNQTAHAVPDITLAALIEHKIATTPDATAVVFGNTSLTYADLGRRSVALAAQLQTLGTGRNSIVAVALPRSLELVIALVAVLRAGAAYLPLDLEHPQDRLDTIVSLSKPVALLAHTDFGAGFQSVATLSPEQWAEEGVPTAAPAQGDMAYVIFTSGSTGQPKGVVVEHRAIVNRLEWMREHYGFTVADRILQKTPATFDVSVWEFFLPLISGATLVVAPPDAHRDPAAIAQLIRNHAVTALHFVPSMLAAFVGEPASANLQVARIFASGEALPADLCARFHERLTAELHNLYGPTEAAVDVSYWPATRGDTSTTVPIGFPVWNTRLYILDAQMRPVPAGVAGDLYLGGVQLARGYLGRDDLTAERFLPDPFLPGERIYRSGDIASRRADGAVTYLGRSDHQVKIRGLRIELGEIEAVIAQSGLVREIAVIDREDRPGDKKLVAYCVADAALDVNAMLAHLALMLPSYMCPAAFVQLEVLPVTSNGKLDRNALPRPIFEAPLARPLDGNTQSILAGLFAEALGTTAFIGADADFFALGGDSLSAVHLLLGIREAFDVDPGLGGLMEHPTIEALAHKIDAEKIIFDSGLGPLIKLGNGTSSAPPLFVIHPAGGISWCYRDLARALAPRSVYGLQAPGLNPLEAMPQSIDLLAENYVDRILELDLSGPIHLAGWSVGGLIAHAMAVRLESLGIQPGLVAMFDSYPSECWRAEAEPTEAQAIRSLLSIAGYDPEAYPELQTRPEILAFLRDGDSPLGRLSAEGLDGVTRVVLETNRLVRQHHHTTYAGTLTHIRAGLDHVGRPLFPELWQPYAGALDLFSVPFLHPQLTSAPAVAEIAPQLAQRLVSIDTERQS